MLHLHLTIFVKFCDSFDFSQIMTYEQGYIVVFLEFKVINHSKNAFTQIIAVHCEKLNPRQMDSDVAFN